MEWRFSAVTANCGRYSNKKNEEGIAGHAGEVFGKQLINLIVSLGLLLRVNFLYTFYDIH
ncbi:hypothetical protein YWY31_06320 [Paenibacillus illinoisensis]